MRKGLRVTLLEVLIPRVTGRDRVFAQEQLRCAERGGRYGASPLFPRTHQMRRGGARFAPSLQSKHSRRSCHAFGGAWERDRRGIIRLLAWMRSLRQPCRLSLIFRSARTDLLLLGPHPVRLACAGCGATDELYLLGDGVFFGRSRLTCWLLTAAGFTVAMACCRHGWPTAVCLGEETLPPCESSLSCRVRAFCGRMMPHEAYRPFDDHYPRFHPVPTSPVFPSLYDISLANGALARPAGRSERGPVASPENEAPQPVPLPEVVPTPPANPSESRVPAAPIPQRQSLRRNLGTASWIFLPGEMPSVREDGQSGRAREMASEGGRLVR